MIHRKRAVLFLILAVLFILTTPIVISYSLGWRIDFENWRIIKPGVFYLKAWPKSAEIYFNGQLKKKTDFFFGAGYIENIPPQKYEIEIKKEGFYDWKKILEVKSGEVTELKNIVLIPKNPNFKIITDKATDFFFCPEKNCVILKEKSLSENENWALKFLDLNKDIRSHLISDYEIMQKTPVLKSKKASDIQISYLSFSQDSKKVLIEISSNELKDSKFYYLLEIDRNPPSLTYLDYITSDLGDIIFNPKNNQKIFSLKDKLLREIDLNTKTISSNTLENILAYFIDQNNFYYIDSSGAFFRSDLGFSGREKITNDYLPITENSTAKVYFSHPYFLIKIDDILYLFNQDKNSLEKIAQPIKDFIISSDHKKLAYFNDYEISILFLEKKYDQPLKEVGDKSFLTRFSEKIDKVFWYNNHYLIFNTGDKIKITEIDDRDKINIVDFSNFKAPEIFWNKLDKKIYILSEGNLYSSEKLVP
ncbi:MAG: hypothetical protein PHI53_00025 [Candidatus Pacebacteria bacterium]|nr:hypothetical protein [Candidatus Paceibacterota bacterium]